MDDPPICGRYTHKAQAEALAAEFDRIDMPDLDPRYNIAQTQGVALVRLDLGSGERRGDLVNWGLVPIWADDSAKRVLVRLVRDV